LETKCDICGREGIENIVVTSHGKDIEICDVCIKQEDTLNYVKNFMKSDE